MKRFLLALALCLLPSLASAQCNGVFAAHTVCGNSSGSPAIPGQIPQSAVTGVPGGTNGQTQYNNSNAFGGYTPSQDCTVVPSTGVFTCLKTNNVLFGPLATDTGTGILSGTINTQTINYAIQTSDCSKTIQAGTGTTGSITITLPVVAGFPTNCIVAVTNGDTGRGKFLGGFPVGLHSSTLYPGQTIVVQIVNGAWATINQPGRWVLTAATTIYIRPDGNDNNDGLANSATGAYKTANAAVIAVAGNIDINGRSDLLIEHTCAAPPCTINTTNQLLILPITPGLSTSSVVFVGGIPTYDGDPLGTTLAAPSGCCDIQLDYQAISLNIGSHFTYAGSPTIAAIYMGGGAFANLLGGIFGNISGGGTTTSHIVMNSNAKIFVLGNYTISGSPGTGGAHAWAEFEGYIEYGAPLTFTCTTALTMAVWALASNNGVLTWPGATFSGCGSVTAQRFVSNTAGGVNTSGGGATYFPGNVGGAATTPGWTQ